MELTPGVLITVTVVVAVSLVLIRLSRRGEAAAPEPPPTTPPRSNRFVAREVGEQQALVQWLLDRALEQTGIRVADDPLARQRIEEAAGKAMTELSTRDSTTISLPFLTADARGPRHFEIAVTRNTLKELAT